MRNTGQFCVAIIKYRWLESSQVKRFIWLTVFLAGSLSSMALEPAEGPFAWIITQ